MVKNPEILKKFEDDLIRKSDSTFEQRLKIFDDMRKLAIKLGVFPPKNSPEGIEKNINLVRKLNYDRFKDSSE